MKKVILITALALLFTSLSAGAQTVYDAAKLADKDLNGTARFVGMGGAMSALGGDISTMGTNPAGIGVYRGNDIMGSFGFLNYNTKSIYRGNEFSTDNNRGTFDNFGAVMSTKVGNETQLRYVNFGFNYTRSKSFYKNMAMGGLLNTGPNGEVFSQVDQMAIQANGTNANLGADDIFNDNRAGWLAALGWNTNLLKEDEEGYHVAILDRPTSSFRSRETGGIDQYDFNVAFNLSDRVYLGLTLGAYDVNYNKYTFYDEDYGNTEGYNLQSWNNIDGSGIDFKAGIIVRPFEMSPFRVGFSIHTPTFYKLTLSTSARLESDVFTDDNLSAATPYMVDTYNDLNGDMEFVYKLNTPWKYNFSLGYTIGNYLALGAEYEYEDYSTMSFRYAEGDKMDFESGLVKSSMRGVNTFRIGAEYKPIPEFAIRGGYNYSSAAFNKNAYKELPRYSINTDTDFANSKATSNYTLGIGYRGRVFYADLAYKFHTYKEDFYAFDDYNFYLNKTKVTNSMNQVLFTLGMRF